MGNVNMEASQINYRNNSKKSVRTVETALDNLYTKSDTTAQDIIDLTAAMTAKADKIDIAPTFSAENTYFAGDLVFQSGRLWKFTTDHTPGEWNQEEVSATNIDLALKAVDVSLPDYSTTEQATGQKWIDGKDIYFRAYTGLSVQMGTVWTDTHVDISSIETIVGGVAIDDAGQLIDSSFGGTSDNSLLIRAPFSGNTIANIVLYYTKVTV